MATFERDALAVSLNVSPQELDRRMEKINRDCASQGLPPASVVVYNEEDDLTYYTFADEFLLHMKQIRDEGGW